MSESKFVTPRRSATLLALATLLAAPLQAQQAATVHGTVVNAVTRQPIAHALVSLEQYGLATLTDNEGRFTFDSVPVGETSLSTRRPGFFSDDTGLSNISREQVAVSAAGADQTLELVPQAAITGELLLPGEDSPDSLQVQLLHQEVRNGRGHWSILRNAEVNSEGHFRFGNLAAGAYLVHIGASMDPAPAQQPPGSTKVRSGYVPVFYPAAREIAGAGILTVTAGQQADIKMELTREPYYPVVVPVANYEDARGVGFEVASDSFLGLPARFSPEDGMVHMELPVGHYLLEAHGYGQRALVGQREFDVNGGAGVVRAGAITLLPPNRIPVTVHTEFTHTTVTVPDGASHPQLVNLDLQRQGDGPATHGEHIVMQDDAAGDAQLLGVSPGKYWVNSNPTAGYIASMTSGGVDLLQDALTVGADGSAPAIIVTLRDDTATLAATLDSSLLPTGQGARPSIYLQLIPQAGSGVARTETFAADGTAHLSSLAPGAYLAFASTTRRQIEYRNPTVLAAFATRAQAIHVEPAGTASITIDSLVNPLANTSEGAP